mmetsp:Transcript_62732/g.136371  ORF Transcript_62732/g.136371 Transcript_62732/m.136371 type:complete len:135 (+) Transcript_62732:143-547(+)
MSRTPPPPPKYCNEDAHAQLCQKWPWTTTQIRDHWCKILMCEPLICVGLSRCGFPVPGFDTCQHQIDLETETLYFRVAFDSHPEALLFTCEFSLTNMLVCHEWAKLLFVLSSPSAAFRPLFVFNTVCLPLNEAV